MIRFLSTLGYIFVRVSLNRIDKVAHSTDDGLNKIMLFPFPVLVKLVKSAYAVVRVAAALISVTSAYEPMVSKNLLPRDSLNQETEVVVHNPLSYMSFHEISSIHCFLSLLCACNALECLFISLCLSILFNFSAYWTQMFSCWSLYLLLFHTEVTWCHIHSQRQRTQLILNSNMMVRHLNIWKFLCQQQCRPMLIMGKANLKYLLYSPPKTHYGLKIHDSHTEDTMCLSGCHNILNAPVNTGLVLCGQIAAQTYKSNMS